MLFSRRIFFIFYFEIDCAAAAAAAVRGLPRHLGPVKSHNVHFCIKTYCGGRRWEIIYELLVFSVCLNQTECVFHILQKPIKSFIIHTTTPSFCNFTCMSAVYILKYKQYEQDFVL